MFPRPAVSRELAKFIPVELYTDRPRKEDELNTALREKLTKSVTNPVYVVMGPDERVLKIFSFTRDEEQFIATLQGAFERHVAKK